MNVMGGVTNPALRKEEGLVKGGYVIDENL